MPLFTSELSYSDDYPTIEPSLRLDFANARALDPRITFTRASTATYVGRDGLIKTAVDDEPRFDHDPVTGESLGLLIEESRTNIFDQSEDVETWSSGFWTKTNNVAISPDGTQTAGSLVPNVGTTSQSSGRTVTQSAGNYVCSVFAKPNGLTVLKIRFSGSSYQATFNLTGNGSVNSQNNGTASISKRPDGWYRCVFVINDSVGETDQWQLGQSDNSGVDGTNGFYIWGMQVEAGSFPTSYIPTSGSTVTRALEYGYTTNMDFYNQNEGSVLSEIKLLDYGSTSGKVIWSLNQAGGFGEGIYFVNENGSNNIKYSVQNNGSQFSGGIFNSNNFIKSAIGLKENSMINYYNGSLVGSEDTSGTIPNNIGRLVIGNNAWGSSDPSNGSNPSNGHMKSFSYYPKRLANAQLEALTQ